jgi:hypothetical protein
MKAASITNVVQVVTHETLPDGVQVVTTQCDDFAHLRTLPPALSFRGAIYGRTGWNSDRCVAYYRTDAVQGLADILGA